MKIMFSAGEASGDMHAAAVAAELKKNHPDIEMLGMGGPAMKRAGVRIVYDIENLGVIGVVEIIKHILFFFPAARLHPPGSGKRETGCFCMCGLSGI